MRLPFQAQIMAPHCLLCIFPIQSLLRFRYYVCRKRWHGGKPQSTCISVEINTQYPEHVLWCFSPWELGSMAGNLCTSMWMCVGSMKTCPTCGDRACCYSNTSSYLRSFHLMFMSEQGYGWKMIEVKILCLAYGISSANESQMATGHLIYMLFFRSSCYSDIKDNTNELLFSLWTLSSTEKALNMQDIYGNEWK